jgi:hypothetical protein
MFRQSRNPEITSNAIATRLAHDFARKLQLPHDAAGALRAGQHRVAPELWKIDSCGTPMAVRRSVKGETMSASLVE